MFLCESIQYLPFSLLQPPFISAQHRRHERWGELGLDRGEHAKIMKMDHLSSGSGTGSSRYSEGRKSVTERLNNFYERQERIKAAKILKNNSKGGNPLSPPRKEFRRQSFSYQEEDKKEKVRIYETVSYYVFCSSQPPLSHSHNTPNRIYNTPTHSITCTDQIGKRENG